MTCVTGVSGSGKSTLINRTLLPLAATQLNGATTLTAENLTRLMVYNIWIKSLILTKAQLDVLHVLTLQRIQGYLRQFVSYLLKHQKRKLVVIVRVVSRLT